MLKIDNKRTFQRTLFCSNSALTLTHYTFAMNVRNNYDKMCSAVSDG